MPLTHRMPRLLRRLRFAASDLLRRIGAVFDRTTTKLSDVTTAREIAGLAYGVNDPEKLDGRDRERAREAPNRLAERLHADWPGSRCSTRRQRHRPRNTPHDEG